MSPLVAVMILEMFERNPPVRPTVQTEKQAHFAWLRTRLSVERTLMSSVRTSASLIGFGFTIFQFFERLDQMSDVRPARNPGMARIISLLLMTIGTVSLIISMIQYRTFNHYLWSPDFKDIAGVDDKPAWSPAFVVGFLLCLIGLVALVALLVRTAQR